MGSAVVIQLANITREALTWSGWVHVGACG